MTISATAMLCAAVMTDHWEVIRWDKDVIENRIVNNTHDRLYWFLNGRVAKISKVFCSEIFNVVIGQNGV